MRLQSIVALVLLIGIIFGYVIAPAVSVGDERSPVLQAFPEDTKDWNQLSRFVGTLEGDKDYDVMSIIGSPTILRGIKNPSKTLYIAVGLEEKYTQAEKEILRDFFKSGGKIIIADDYGNADDFSNEYGVTFYGQQMWDAKFFANNSYPVVKATLNLDPYLLVFSEPTGLANQSFEDPEKAAWRYTLLANGSERSFVDRNGNHRIDPADAHENVVMAMMVQYNTKVETSVSGAGRLVFIADTAIFSNDMFINSDDLRARGFMDNQYPHQMNLSATKGTNREFVLALVNFLLPDGGIVLFDESRHPQSHHAGAVYGTLRSLTILTSNPLESGLLSVGIVLILIVIVLRARDKESWIHRFDISSIYRRATLPDTRQVQVDHLRKALLAKVRMVNSLSVDELRALTPAQVAGMVKDAQLNELMLDEAKVYSPEEIRAVTLRMRAWGKA